MAFVELAKSVYQNQHKAKPKALTSVEEGKYVRIQKQAKERKCKRGDTFFSNREIMDEDDIPLTPQPDAGPVPKKEVVSDPRKRQMLQWKEERKKRKMMEPKKPPPFKVGVVKHHVAPLQDAIFKNPIKAQPVTQTACHRATRSNTRANQHAPSVTHQQQSFAPQNAMFNAPKITVENKKMTKLTPKRTRAGNAVPLKLTNILSSIMPSKSNVVRPFDFNVKPAKINIIKPAKNNVTQPVVKKQMPRNNKKAAKGRPSSERMKNKRNSGVSKGKRLSGVSKEKRRSVTGNLENKEKQISIALDEKQRSEADVDILGSDLVKENLSSGTKRRSSKSSRKKINSEIKSIVNSEMECATTDVSNISSRTCTPTNKRLSKVKALSLERSDSNNDKSEDRTPDHSSDGQNSGELVISSPFVTVARGKTNQRRETLCKMKLGYTVMSPEKTAQYFRLQLDGEINRLQGLCDKWKQYQEENPQLTEDANDLINLAIGQTQLLMNKKLQQFRGLVMRCESKEDREGEGVVTSQDLQGFWDMVYMQVVNVDQRFHNLNEKKDNNWKEESGNVEVKSKKKPVGRVVKPNKVNTKASSGLKAMIQAARQKTKTAESSLPPVVTLQKPETVTFNGGFFSVISPVKNTAEDQEKKTPAKRTSMLNSILDSEAKKRIAKTPDSAQAILKASQYAKHINNYGDYSEYKPLIDLKKTPAKSILKTPAKNASCVQSSRKSLRVLFSDEDNMELDDETATNDRALKPSSKNIHIPIIVQNNSYIEEDLTSINMEPQIVKTKKKGRLTRQQALLEDNEENVPPAPSSKKEAKSKPTPVKVYNTRRRTSENRSLLEVSIENRENMPKSEPRKSSRRSKRKSINDEDPDTNKFALPEDSTPVSAKRQKRMSLDDRKSINLITFTPEKPPQHSIRYTLRRMSTNVS